MVRTPPEDVLRDPPLFFHQARRVALPGLCRPIPLSWIYHPKSRLTWGVCCCLSRQGSLDQKVVNHRQPMRIHLLTVQILTTHGPSPSRSRNNAHHLLSTILGRGN